MTATSKVGEALLERSRPVLPVTPSPAVSTARTTSSPKLEVSYSQVLVPLDGSDLSLTAMPTARALALAFDADLHTISAARNARHAERLRSFASSALESATGSGRVAVRAGDDASGLVAEHARELGSALICVATRARGRFRHAMFGSVATSISERTAPVVAVGPVAERPTWSRQPRGWPAPLSNSRIVAFVDGTSGSEAGLPWATAWAKALEKSLTILTVVADAPTPIRTESGDDQTWGREAAASYVEQLANECRRDHVDVDSRVVLDPLGPANGLRAHLAHSPASLIVIAKDTRARFPFALRPTTAADIVRSSNAPCLVVL